MFYSSWTWDNVEKVGTLEKVGTSQKSISRKPLACNILYQKKKKPLLKALLSFSWNWGKWYWFSRMCKVTIVKGDDHIIIDML